MAKSTTVRGDVPATRADRQSLTLTLVPLAPPFCPRTSPCSVGPLVATAGKSAGERERDKSSGRFCRLCRLLS